MSSDAISYSVIVFVISAFVIGFTFWQKRRPKSRKPEQAIFLGAAVLSAASVVWFIVEEVRGYSATGILLPTSTYVRFAQTSGLGILFAFAYWISKKKEQEERRLHDASISEKNA